LIMNENKAIFPLGMYDQPQDDDEWTSWTEAGINLVRCRNEEEVEEAHRRGMMAWVPVPLACWKTGDEEALGEMIRSLRDQPSIIAWEAQDEAIWNACRLDDGIVTNRIWAQPSRVKAAIRSRLDALVEGLKRGSSVARELDPGRSLWLNEAAKSDQDTLARCLPYLDIVSYDYYPVPEDPRRGRQMRMLGGFTDMFRRTASTRDLWVVEQAFSWGGLSRASNDKQGQIHEYNSNTWIPMTEEESTSYPGLAELRFMSWIAICHGATGLLWFGSGFEDRPSPLLHDLMLLIGELHEVQPFLTAGNVPSVRATTSEKQCPSISGVSAIARRSGDDTLLALVNEDFVEHDVMVTGLEWIDADDLVPMFDLVDELRSTNSGYVTRMKGQETRLYLSRS